MGAPPVDWTEEAVARLRALWDEGLSTGQIGERMGLSKNAVVGKAHRLNLPSRPSRRSRRIGGQPCPGLRWRSALPRAEVAEKHGIGTERAYALARRLDLPLAVRHKAPVVTLAPLAPLASVGEAVAPVVPVFMRSAPVVPRPGGAVTRKPSGRACCWPIGEPGTRSFRFCDADADRGFSYCGEHRQIAYTKPREAV